MGREWIGSLDGFDPPTLKLSDIDWQYGTGAAVATGEGRHKTYQYRNGVMTKQGDIAEHIWYSLVEGIAQRDGEMWLIEALTTWEEEHNYVKDSSAQLRNRALKHYAARVFECPEWIYYTHLTADSGWMPWQEPILLPLSMTAVRNRGRLPRSRSTGLITERFPVLTAGSGVSFPLSVVKNHPGKNFEV